MEYAFFLGCIAPNRYPNLEAATQKVMNALGVKLLDMEGASCCPAPGVLRSFHRELWLAVGARNITIAEEMGVDITTMCSGCYATLKEVNDLLKEREELRKKVNEVLSKIGREYKGTVEVKHILEVFYFDLGIDEVASQVKRKIPAKVALHYGCHLIKPTVHRRWTDSCEDPRFFEALVEFMGVTPVDYRDKLMCCGAGGGVRSGSPEVALTYTMNKLESMREAGAELLVNACQFCHLQFDLGQVEIKERYGKEYNIPVIFYTQLLGLAMGFSPEDMGLQYNRVEAVSPVKAILERSAE